MPGQPGHNTRPHARLPPSFLGMDEFTTIRSFDSQETWAIDVRGLFFDMSSMDVYTTRQCQTSGRLVQELNVCTVSITIRSAIDKGVGLCSR